MKSLIDTSMRAISQRVVKVGASLIISLGAGVRVEGLEQVPAHGPLLIVARHYHHLYDGCILLRILKRRLHIFVALDWVGSRWQRVLMERACAALTWPVILRSERLERRGTVVQFKVDEAKGYLKRAIKDSVALLHQREALLIFPEAYPNIDPEPNAKASGEAFLPFRAGFARLLELAERDGQTKVAVVPAGFSYKREKGRWRVTMRLGVPLYRDEYESAAALAQAIEQQVRALSEPELIA